MPTLDALDHVHFIGIAGAGMRGLARVVADRDPRVTGCDPSADAELRQMLGDAAVETSHAPDHLTDRFGEAVDLVVHTAALPDDHRELAAAREAGVPTLTYSEALGEIFNASTGIAVAGTHGKTTCATMLAVVLEEAGRDPTAVIGGRVQRWNSHARAGDGEPFVAEACEFGGNFHAMDPTHVLLTNVDRDHLDFYDDHSAIRLAFGEFLADRTGTVVASADDPGASRVVERTEGAVQKVGTADEADWRIRTTSSGRSDFLLEHRETGETSEPLAAPVPGDHQLQNAAQVAVMAKHLGLDWGEIAEGLDAYEGVERRFEVRRQRAPVVIDDYAHHPDEIEATIDSARSAYPNHRLVACFQPHQYKRTFHFMGEWAPAFEDVSTLWLVDIYGARDHDTDRDVSIADVADEVRGEVDELRIFETPAALGEAIRMETGEGDLVLLMGAGDIGEAIERS